jgi:hypothetical protein
MRHGRTAGASRAPARPWTCSHPLLAHRGAGMATVTKVDDLPTPRFLACLDELSSPTSPTLLPTLRVRTANELARVNASKRTR